MKPGHVQALKTILIQFSIPVRYEDLPLFRGAVIETTGRGNDLFHNHSPDGVIYRYPMVQYKKIKGKAALFCIGDGVEAMHDFFSNTNWRMRIGNEELEVRVEELKARQFNVGVWENSFLYQLNNWLPLNQENYQLYRQAETLTGKASILEKALTGNLLTFTEGTGLQPEKRITAAIERIDREKVLKYRGQIMQAYDIRFRTNLSLPNFIGLGKGASVGYGVVMKAR